MRLLSREIFYSDLPARNDPNLSARIQGISPQPGEPMLLSYNDALAVNRLGFFLCQEPQLLALNQPCQYQTGWGLCPACKLPYGSKLSCQCCDEYRNHFQVLASEIVFLAKAGTKKDLDLVLEHLLDVGAEARALILEFTTVRAVQDSSTIILFRSNARLQQGRVPGVNAVARNLPTLPRYLSFARSAASFDHNPAYGFLWHDFVRTITTRAESLGNPRQALQHITLPSFGPGPASMAVGHTFSNEVDVPLVEADVAGAVNDFLESWQEHHLLAVREGRISLVEEGPVASCALPSTATSITTPVPSSISPLTSSAVGGAQMAPGGPRPLFTSMSAATTFTGQPPAVPPIPVSGASPLRSVFHQSPVYVSSSQPVFHPSIVAPATVAVPPQIVLPEAARQPAQQHVDPPSTGVVPDVSFSAPQDLHQFYHMQQQLLVQLQQLQAMQQFYLSSRAQQATSTPQLSTIQSPNGMPNTSERSGLQQPQGPLSSFQSVPPQPPQHSSSPLVPVTASHGPQAPGAGPVQGLNIFGSQDFSFFPPTHSMNANSAAQLGKYATLAGATITWTRRGGVGMSLKIQSYPRGNGDGSDGKGRSRLFDIPCATDNVNEQLVFITDEPNQLVQRENILECFRANCRAWAQYILPLVGGDLRRMPVYSGSLKEVLANVHQMVSGFGTQECVIFRVCHIISVQNIVSCLTPGDVHNLCDPLDVCSNYFQASLSKMVLELNRSRIQQPPQQGIRRQLPMDGDGQAYQEGGAQRFRQNNVRRQIPPAAPVVQNPPAPLRVSNCQKFYRGEPCFTHQVGQPCPYRHYCKTCRTVISASETAAHLRSHNV
jgi:hypothetical protein